MQLRADASVALQASCFISVLGGNAVLASYFAGTNLVYAVKGEEMKTYGQGNKSYELQHMWASLAAALPCLGLPRTTISCVRTHAHDACCGGGHSDHSAVVLQHHRQAGNLHGC